MSKLKSKTVMIISMVMGLFLYIQGFIFISKFNGILMVIGGLLIFVPVMILGISKRKDKRLLSNIFIGVSAFFILVLTFVLIGIIIEIL